MNRLGSAALMAATTLCSLNAVAQDELETVPVHETAPAAATETKSAGPHVDVYYVPTSEFEQGNVSEDGDGLGLRGLLPFTVLAVPLFVVGEYTSTTLEQVDQDVENTRLGLGYRFNEIFGAYIEHASIEFNNELSGLGMHGRAEYGLPPFAFHGELGYLALENNRGPDVAGVEFSIGATYRVYDRFSALLDYRSTELSASGFSDGTLTDLKLGARVAFD